MLPGLSGAMMLAGDPFPRPALLTSATSTGATIAVPASAKAGDLLVLADIGLNTGATGSPPSATVPTDFTKLIDMDFGTSRALLSWKIAEAGDASSTLTGMNANSSVRKILGVFGGGKAISSITSQSLAEQVVNGNPTAQTVTSSGGTVPLMVFGFYAAWIGAGLTTTIDPRTFTVGGSDAKDGELSNETGEMSIWIAFKSYFHNETPANVVVDMDNEGVSFLGSFYLQVS